ncbi:poly-beta-1,6 N-acetyl-D-glucosamine export porin PgaA [Vagococcus sp. WN89Y]|uniref:poly-beta-1,6 N-acetyl-D-glucosamine export porin PgaA n=1 Tax=Vagococcus sp. WN89Y TaxID=3457258 RepID=UPI003FCD99B9
MRSQRPFYKHSRLAWALGFILFSASATAADAVYDRLVLQARNGQTQALLTWLQEREQHSTLTVSQVADWLQVAGWAGRDRDVVRVWERYHLQMDIPVRGITAAARAYRNLKQWDTSLALWERARQKASSDEGLRAGRVLTLVDAQKNIPALVEAEQLVQDDPSLQSYQALGYVWRAEGKNWDQLFAMTKAWQHDRDNASVKSDVLDAWTASRIADPALNLSRSMTLPEAKTRRLELDAAAELVRIAQITSRGESERFLVADKALARYDSLLAQWKFKPEAQADYRTARIDRLGALFARGRYAEVVQEAQSLQADGQPLPGYTDLWVATALLAQRRPEESYELFSRNPGNVTQPDMFYAAMESNNLPAAKRIVDRMIAITPYQVHDYGSTVKTPNDQWLINQLQLAEYYALTGDLAGAEKLTGQMTRTAPGNQEVRINYATVLASRGLPRAAQVQLKIAEALGPLNQNLIIQQAYNAQTLQQWRAFEQLTDNAVERSPESSATRQLARARNIHHKSELRINASKGISSDSPVSGSRDFTWNSVLYGPPLAEHWRPFAGFNFVTGRFEEGSGYNRDVLGGVEFTARDYWVEAALSNQNFGQGNKLGARLSLWHDFSDHWRVGATAERLSASTPLRALRNGVTANGGQAFVRWYHNERREYQLSIAPGWFSDGNRRVEYGLTGKERLLTRPYFTLDLTPDISASTNSKENVPYYNPKRDLSVTPGLSAEHILYRRYETVWSQLITAGAGAYWQKGQGTGLITQLGYGQRVQLNNVLDVGVTVMWDKRPYDGKRERNLGVAFDMNLRF